MKKLPKTLSSRFLPALAAVTAAGIMGASSADAQQFLNNFGDGIDEGTGAGDNLWSTVANWNAPIPSGNVAWINVSAAHSEYNQDQNKPAGGPATINYAAPSISEFYIGQGGGSGHVLMTTGGSITAINMNMAHDGSQSGRYDQDGGQMTLTGNLNAGQQATGNNAKVNISGGTFQSANMFLGHENGGGTNATISGGTVTTGEIRLSDVNAGSSATSSLDITGGTVNAFLIAGGARSGGSGTGAIAIGGNAVVEVGQNIFLRAGSGNSFTADGSNATININRAYANNGTVGFEVSANSVVNFNADANGFSTVNLVDSNMFFSGAGGVLNIDATLLDANGTWDLFGFREYRLSSGVTEFGTVNIDTAPGHSGFVTYNGDSIQYTHAIPEPSTYAAIFGGIALLGVMIRRRFRR